MPGYYVSLDRYIENSEIEYEIEETEIDIDELCPIVR